MKNRNPNSPTTIRGMRERYSRRGVLDTRKQSEADILTAEVVGPFGKAFDRMKLPGSDQEFIVANQSKATLAPGSSGLLTNSSGKESGLTRIGGPPPGKKGGGSASRSHRRRGTIPVDANQYAFGTDGVDLYAMLYSDASYVSDRGTSATFANNLVVGCILTDPTELVGDGSALIYDENTPLIAVWDIENATSYTYSAPAGWSLLYIHPRYCNGAIYWIEYDTTAIVGHADNSFNFRLRTAATDLTGASTVATIAVAATDLATYTHFHSDPMHGGTLMVDTDGAVVYFWWKVYNVSESFDYLQTQYRIALSGGAESHRIFSADTYPILGMDANNYPTDSYPAGGFVQFDGTEVHAKVDDAATEATLLWTPAASGLACSLNVALDGTTVQFCAGESSSNFKIYRNNAPIASSVDFFNGTESVTQMFFFGE